MGAEIDVIFWEFLTGKKYMVYRIVLGREFFGSTNLPNFDTFAHHMSLK